MKQLTSLSNSLTACIILQIHWGFWMKPNHSTGHQHLKQLQPHIGAEWSFGSWDVQGNMCLGQFAEPSFQLCPICPIAMTQWMTSSVWFGLSLSLCWSSYLPMTPSLVASFPAFVALAVRGCKDEGSNQRKFCIASTLVCRGVCTISRLPSCSFSQFSCKPRESFPCWVF